jgi:hypothetical protein
MQGQYGVEDGRRIFIKKALEQGHGATVRDRVANIYAHGAKGKKAKKVSTIVQVKGTPKVKIISARKS